MSLPCPVLRVALPYLVLVQALSAQCGLCLCALLATSTALGVEFQLIIAACQFSACTSAIHM